MSGARTISLIQLLAPCVDTSSLSGGATRIRYIYALEDSLDRRTFEVQEQQLRTLAINPMSSYCALLGRLAGKRAQG